jgi:hypothetical protein
LIRILKLVVISAVILFLLVTAVSLLLPSHIRVSRAIDIQSPKESIYPFIADLRQWKKWNQFAMHSDSMKTLHEISAVELKAADLQIILQKSAADTVETTWIQNGKASDCHFMCLQGKNFCVVQWYFDFHLKWYPWEKFQSIIYDRQLGPFMEASLNNLKMLAENSGNQ